MCRTYAVSPFCNAVKCHAFHLSSPGSVWQPKQSSIYAELTDNAVCPCTSRITCVGFQLNWQAFPRSSLSKFVCVWGKCLLSAFKSVVALLWVHHLVVVSSVLYWVFSHFSIKLFCAFLLVAQDMVSFLLWFVCLPLIHCCCFFLFCCILLVQFCISLVNCYGYVFCVAFTVPFSWSSLQFIWTREGFVACFVLLFLFDSRSGWANKQRIAIFKSGWMFCRTKIKWTGWGCFFGLR